MYDADASLVSAIERESLGRRNEAERVAVRRAGKKPGRHREVPLTGGQSAGHARSCRRTGWRPLRVRVEIDTVVTRRNLNRRSKPSERQVRSDLVLADVRVDRGC